MLDKLIIEKKKEYNEKSNSFVPSKFEFEIKRVVMIEGKPTKSVVALYNSANDTIRFNPIETYIDRKEFNEINKLVSWASRNLHKKHEPSMER